jgi:hypothetical protein
MHIRKSLVIFGLVLALLLLATSSALAASGSSAPPSHAQTIDQAPVFVAPAIMATLAAHQATYVYITHTGIKYHRNGCRYLAHSKIRKTLKWVKSHGYKPCKVCKPPR